MIDNFEELDKKLSKDLFNVIDTIDKLINQIEKKELTDESYQEVSELFINFKDELRLIVDLEKSEEE